jgi:hypothetical protein
MVLISKVDIPSSLTLLNWAPDYLFPVSPSLVIDDISWLLALALIALSLTIVIISIAQLGLSRKEDTRPTETKPQVVDEANLPSTVFPPTIQVQANAEVYMPNWLFWIVVLVTTSFGLVAVSSGNILTLLLSWIALDLIELAILIGQSLKSEDRERAAIIFSIKMTGTVLVLTAGLMILSQGGSLNFTALSPPVSILLILAAAVRLGVLSPLIPFSHRLMLRHDLSTVLYLVSASACFILLIRVASSGSPGVLTPFLIALTLIVGLITAVQWLTAADELRGKRYWLVTSASLTILAALVNQPAACLAWGTASLLSGGLIFSLPIRHRNLIPIMILGIFNLSAIPLSPTWQSTRLFQSLLDFSSSRLLGLLFSLGVLLIQAFLLAGFIRHMLKTILPLIEDKSIHIERWVWVLYPIGLVSIVLAHLLVGWYLLPDLHGLPIYSWIIGPIILLISGVIIYTSDRYQDRQGVLKHLASSAKANRVITNEWLYNLIWRVYRSISKLTGLISTMLEGEGGILWALVLFALIFVFLQR